LKRSVTVEVAGQKLQIRTDATDDYIASLARYVNDKIGEIRASSLTASTTSKRYGTHVLAVLAALHIADELFDSREKDAKLRRRVREKGKRILELLENVRDV
jgi:cell division protein ZapA (FtsZ GTPase activity inhibitor)